MVASIREQMMDKANSRFGIATISLENITRIVKVLRRNQVNAPISYP